MKHAGFAVLALVSLSVLGSQAMAQKASTAPDLVTVPRLVNFSGRAVDAQGKAITGTTGITFAIYSVQFEGAPLWLETQNIQTDSKGNYTAQLGATKSEGLPLELFSSGEARWLAIRINGGDEQPRVLLLSVPYALKAADAQTLGGLPASAFALAGSRVANPQPSTTVASSATSESSPVGGTGTQNYIPIWIDNTGDLGNSILYQTGSGSTAKIGINEKNPLFTLDVNGQELVRGLFEMATTNYATKTKGFSSNPLNLESSAYNSGTAKYTLNHFQWQAEPAGNNTTTPGATLNLLYGTDPALPTETGLVLSSTGQVTFAAGQTFPGTGSVTSVGSGAGLTGGPITGSGSLSIATAGVSNAMLANPSLTIAAGTDLTGGGSVALGGSTTLNLDTTKVPQLKTANTFTGNQTVNGNLTATGVISGSSYQIGSNLFAFGSYANNNAFMGFAGNASMTGIENTASGYGALFFNTTGNENSANGWDALYNNTTGGANTAIGGNALSVNTTGSANTATGYGALQGNFAGYGNTANGYGALATNTASGSTAVGYQALFANNLYPNTATGYQALSHNTSAIGNTANGYQALYENILGAYNTATGYQALYSNAAAQFTANENTADGYQALYTNVLGAENTAVGNRALNSANTIGNTAVGNEALGANQLGTYNTAVGDYALAGVHPGDNTAVGGFALSQLTDGTEDTAVGFSAQFPENSFDDTCIGYECSAGTNASSNATAIGAHSRVDESNALVLGGTGPYAVKVGIGTTTPSNILTIARGSGHPVSDSWETYSSRRWKTNIQTLPDALAKVEHLRGVSYELKDSGKHEIGVIAEEVGRVVPEVVSYEANGKDASGVDYSRLTALLIEAVKQQQKQIVVQRKQLAAQAAAQRDQVRALRTRLARLQGKVDGLVRAKASEQKAGSGKQAVIAKANF
jgi:endosialidase-like protein